MVSAKDFAVNPSDYTPGSFNQGNVFERIGDWFTGRDRAAEYNQAAANYDKAYEQANLTAARNWEQYMDSSAVQRRVEDIKAAGLNPYLALNGGSLGSLSGASTEAGGSAKNVHNVKSGDNPLDTLRSMMKDMMNYTLNSSKVLLQALKGD